MSNTNFIVAFNHAMLEEVGSFWDPTDPDVKLGSIGTKEQKRKVGYVNIPEDPGGETKYGIAVNANPEINIVSLNLEQAQNIYFNNYWLAGKCDKLPFPLGILHFDGCINHGVGQASKFLQRAVGVTADGAIGSVTLQKIDSTNISDIINNIITQREQFYSNIVQRKPTSQKFLKGWLARISRIKAFTLSKI